MVSRSRISPIKITSGAWRSVFLRAASQLSVSRPTSRCVMMQFLWGCTNSIGSSMVMMCPWECSLRQSTMAAKEVDLPEPVAPTKMHRPRWVIATSLSTCGRPMESMEGIVAGMVRSTRPTRPCWIKALARKRPMPAGEIAKLHSLVRSNSATCLSLMMERASDIVCAATKGWSIRRVTLPSTLMAGGKSAVINKSLPLRATMSLRRSLINLLAWSRSMSLSPIAGVNRGSFQAIWPCHVPLRR